MGSGAPSSPQSVCQQSSTAAGLVSGTARGDARSVVRKLNFTNFAQVEEKYQYRVIAFIWSGDIFSINLIKHYNVRLRKTNMTILKWREHLRAIDLKICSIKYLYEQNMLFQVHKPYIGWSTCRGDATKQFFSTSHTKLNKKYEASPARMHCPRTRIDKTMFNRLPKT